MSNIKLNKLLNLVHNEKKALKILVIRNGLIGDTVFITPVLFRLNKNLPTSIIDVLTGYKSNELLDQFPGIQNIYTLPKQFKVLEHVKFFFSLRKNNYDIILIQELNTHYTLISKITGAKIIIGYKNKLSWLIDLDIERKGHIVHAEQLLIDRIFPCPDVPTILYTTAVEDNRADQILLENNLRKGKIIVCIQVSCSEKNSVRKWQNDKLSKLCDYILERYDSQIYFSGVQSELDEIKTVQNGMKHSSVSLAGKTSLRELIAIIKKTTFVIGPDTGTLHIANAVRTPVIMYMGFSDPKETGPYDDSGLSKIIKVNLDCAPCCEKNPKPLQWEYCKNHRPAKCMEMIKVDDMISAVDSLIYKITN